MDIIFDIDGTLANAERRLPYIRDMNRWVPGGITRNMVPDWDSFLNPDNVALDEPIPHMWFLMESLLVNGAAIIFITGRPERLRQTTWDWLTDITCDHRGPCARYLTQQTSTQLYMRDDEDRRPSHMVKEDLLDRARFDGYVPQIVFEDREQDADMWREKGLLCLKLPEGA